MYHKFVNGPKYLMTMDKMKIVTLNARGLRDHGKRRDLFYYLCKKQCDVIFLQEVHGDSDAKLWSMEWGSKIWFSHGERNARGVAILFRKDLNVDIHNVIQDKVGRYIILYVTCNKLKLLLSNIYAPKIDSPDFFTNYFRDVKRFTPDHAILGGDMNLALEKELDRAGSGFNNEKAAQTVREFLESENFVDVWRVLHPDINGYTWCKLKPKPVFSRLDYFFTTENSLQLINKIDIKRGFKTDHSMLELEIQLIKNPRGPGYWKLNTSLLRDIEYVEKINKLLDIQLEVNNQMSFRKGWEMIKLEIKSSSLQYSARKQKSKRNLIQVLEKKLKDIKKDIDYGGDLFKDNYEQRRLIKFELEKLIKDKAMGAKVRSKAQWALQGELPTKYFLNLEKKHAKNRVITQLINDQGETISNPNEVLNEISRYYQVLYTSKGRINLDYLDKIVVNQLSPDTKQNMDSPLTVEELGQALKMMENNKSPGTDGLPCDFYKVLLAQNQRLLSQSNYGNCK